MANKAISELPQAQNVNNQDLFVLEQSGIAKKLPAETFITEQGIINALAEALDGHGGIQSVTLASVSGRIRTYRITFTDQSATTFQVYDGTSIDRISRTSSSGLDDVYTIFLSDGTTTFFTVHNGADGTVSEAMLNDALKDKAPAITETTESSAIANFPDGADDMVMHNIVAEINPVQSGSGDPSPSNIRPITGWTGANVTRAGKNLLDTNAFVQGTIDADSGNEMISSTRVRSPFIFLTAGSYAVSSTNGFQIVFDVYDENKQFIRSESETNWKSAPHTYSVTNNRFVRILFKKSNDTGITPVELTGEMMELGSTATAYEPYQGNTVTVDWTTEAGTVYGGTIDVATGLLTVDRAYALLNDASKWETYTQGNVDYIYQQQFTRKQYSDSYTGLICTAFPSSASSALRCRWRGANSLLFGVYDLNHVLSLDQIKSMAEANQIAICYDIEPITYQLTGQQLMTLYGNNSVWADVGNVSVTYPADTKMFIEKLTMPTEDDLVANQAITSGKYFMVGNSLYLALANIASGAQITIGTNAQRVSLADALNTINS